MHIRGPAHLKQFAVYTPGSLFGKREAAPAPKPSFHKRRHGHHHAHAKRADSDSAWKKLVSPENKQSPQPSSPETSHAPPASLQKKPVGGDSGSAPPVKAGLGEWGRQAFYNAEKGLADGLVFLNHHGGEGSGVFDRYGFFPVPVPHAMSQLR